MQTTTTLSRQQRRLRERALVRSTMTKTERRTYKRMKRYIRKEIESMTLQMIADGRMAPINPTNRSRPMNRQEQELVAALRKAFAPKEQSMAAQEDRKMLADLVNVNMQGLTTAQEKTETIEYQ